MKRIALFALAGWLALGCAKKDEKKPDDKKAPETATKTVEEAPPKTPDKPAEPDFGAYKLTKAADLTWAPLAPGQDAGPKMAVVHGDPMSDGPSAFFLKIPAKGEAGFHKHSGDYSALVVSGKHKHWLPGDKKVTALNPGSYWVQPGNQEHGDTCEGPEDCVLFIMIGGKFDMTPTPDVKKVAKNDAYKVVRVEDDKFAPMDPNNAAGPKLAIVDGDPEKGPVAFLIDVPAGGGAGVHKHSSDYQAVVLSGAPTHWPDGGKGEGDGLETGTYWFQPGEQMHGDTCSGEAGCRLFIYMPGKLDFFPKG